MNDLKELGIDIKNKNVEAIRKNGMFVIQSVVCLSVLIFCGSLLVSGKTNGTYETMIWSTIFTILGAYLPKAGYQKPPAGAGAGPTSIMPGAPSEISIPALERAASASRSGSPRSRSNSNTSYDYDYDYSEPHYHGKV